MSPNVGLFLETYQRIDKAYRKYFLSRLAHYGFTPNEIVVILFLYNNAPEADTATDIAKRKGISKGLITRSVESLCRKDVLEAVRDTKDRRIIHLRLKNSHSEMAAELEKIQRIFFREIEKNISPEDIEITRRTLCSLLNNAESFSDRRESYAD